MVSYGSALFRTALRPIPLNGRCHQLFSSVASPDRSSSPSSLLPSPSFSPSLSPSSSPSSSSLPSPSFPPSLLTLAIETSCDDTCVALLLARETPFSSSSSAQTFAFPTASPPASLLFNQKITSDNRQWKGIQPAAAVDGHTASLAPLLDSALASLPPYSAPHDPPSESFCSPQSRTSPNPKSSPPIFVGGTSRRRPDFVTVTRGPGMGTSLAVGLNTAKGLAVAWGVPLVAVHHMQAHALTPRLVDAIEEGGGGKDKVEFPFLSLLVSGGHTILVYSTGLLDHRVLADADCIAIGDCLDKAARLIVPPDRLAASSDTMYGRELEKFAFPGSTSSSASEATQQKPYDYEYAPLSGRGAEHEPLRPLRSTGYAWHVNPSLANTRRAGFNFSGISGQALAIMQKTEKPGSGSAGRGMEAVERRVLAQVVQRAAFEHLVSRLLIVLEDQFEWQQQKHKGKRQQQQGTRMPVVPKILVVSGGVASNRYLMHILRSNLDVRGHAAMRIVAPPAALCTDNAAMIAWAGVEMYRAGYETDLGALAITKWPMDPGATGGGIINVGGWKERA